MSTAPGLEDEQPWQRPLTQRVSQDCLALYPEAARILLPLIDYAGKVHGKNGIGLPPPLRHIRDAFLAIAPPDRTRRPTDPPAAAALGTAAEEIGTGAAAALLGCSREHANRLARSGVLGRTRKVGNRRLVDRAVTLAYRADRRT